MSSSSVTVVDRLGNYPFNEPWRRTSSTSTLEVKNLGELDPGLLLRGQSCVWTGSLMLIYGGVTTSALVSGHVWTFDPNTGEFRQLIAGQHTPAERAFHTAVWTGSEMLVYGGSCGVSCSLSDTWTLELLPPPPPPPPPPELPPPSLPPSPRPPEPPTTPPPANETAPTTGETAFLPTRPPLMPSPLTPPPMPPAQLEASPGQWTKLQLPPGVFGPQARERHSAVWAASLGGAGAMVIMGGALAQTRRLTNEVWVYYPQSGALTEDATHPGHRVLLGGRWERVLEAPQSMLPPGRQSSALMWTGHGLVVFGGRTDAELATNELWHYDWNSRCWRDVNMETASWPPTQQGSALLLPSGFNSTRVATDGIPIIAVAAPATTGTAAALGVFTRPAADFMEPVDLCEAMVVGSSAEAWLQAHAPQGGGEWFEFHAGGLQFPIETDVATTEVSLEPGAHVPAGDESDFCLEWQADQGRLLLVRNCTVV